MYEFRRCYPVYFSQNVGKAITDQEVFDELRASGADSVTSTATGKS